MVSTWKVRAIGGSPGMIADEEEVRRAIRLFAQPGEFFETISLKKGVQRTRKGDDVDGIFNDIESLPGGIGIYFRINPVTPGRQKSASNSDILKRCWLYIDVDPCKEAGHEDDPATEEEKRNTVSVADSVNEYLHSRGWPAPVVVDSGNGYGLFYRCDLPNDKYTQSIYQKLLKLLSEKFSGPSGTIDKSVHNANRLAKMPGTWARKGIESNERPHRPCRVINVPTSAAAVGIEELVAVSDEQKPVAAPLKRDSASGPYGKKALDNECARVALAIPGSRGGEGRNNALNRAAFSLGQLVAGGVIDQIEVEQRLYDAACACGLQLDDGERGIRATINSGIESGKQQPRSAPEKNDPKAVIGKKLVEEAKAGKKRLTVTLSAVRPQKVEWLIADRIPKRFITVFAGRTSVGKSFVACDLISRLSVGGEIPGGGGECFAPGGTLILSEDSHEYVLAPRLITMGADMTRVNAMTWEAMGSYFLGNTDMLEQACQEVNGGVSLVMIDPPTNFLCDVDEHKNSEVRQLVMKVVEWCFTRDLACLFVLHVNKQTGKGVEALNRVMGSVAWVTTARVAHSFCEDPDDPERCLWVPTKNNLGPMPKGLAYRIEGPRDAGKVVWLGEVDTTANEAMGGGKKERRDVTASRWLIEQFREKRSWDSDDLFRAGQAAGVSRNAIFEAKKLLSLPQAKRVILENGNIKYVWWVPEQWAPLDDQDTGTHGTPVVP